MLGLISKFNLDIATLTLVIGMIIGSIMLLSVCWVYLRHHSFGFGGTVLTCFGVILIGLSIWKTVDVSVTKEGIKAKFSLLQEKVENIREAREIFEKNVGENINVLKTNLAKDRNLLNEKYSQIELILTKSHEDREQLNKSLMLIKSNSKEISDTVLAVNERYEQIDNELKKLQLSRNDFVQMAKATFNYIKNKTGIQYASGKTPEELYLEELGKLNFIFYDPDH